MVVLHLIRLIGIDFTRPPYEPTEPALILGMMKRPIGLPEFHQDLYPFGSFGPARHSSGIGSYTDTSLMTPDSDRFSIPED